MTNYDERDSMVRIDRFKESGKWYDTYAVDMNDHYLSRDIDGNYNLIHDALRKSIAQDERFGPDWVKGWLDQGGFIVCLEPYHDMAHPIVLKGN